MSKVGTGLLHEDLISRIAKLSEEGSVAILYVDLQPEIAEAAEEWASLEEGLFWKQRLDTGFLYWLYHPAASLSVDRLTERAAEQIRKRIAEAEYLERIEERNGAKAFGIGAALMQSSPSPASPEEAEAVLLRLMQEAVERGKRDRAPGEREQAKKVARAIGATGSSYTIGMLAARAPLFECSAKVSEVAYLFDTNPNVQGAIVVKEERPAGVIMRDRLYQQLAGQFGYALYSSRSVERVMDPNPLIVEEHTTVERVSQLAMSRDDSRLYDIVVTVKDGIVSGAATIRGILECMTTLRTEEARTANPLTGLPGNAGIEAELSRRIANREPFAVVYADLDYFKWFNDCFGFARGDELIRYLAETMVAEFEGSDSSRSFVGHIGGDDFIGVADPEYAESICERLIRSFDGGVQRYYGNAEVSVVENRQGQKVEQNGVTLSLSLLQCGGNGDMNLEDISICAARLKKRAKSIKGSVYVAGEWNNSQPREK